jgi:hypothetical protein
MHEKTSTSLTTLFYWELWGIALTIKIRSIREYMAGYRIRSLFENMKNLSEN